SGPGLGVGPTNPLTSGQKPEACPPKPHAPSQPKSGPEVQEPGGFLGACEARPGLRREAEQPPFLDQIQINRNNELGRGKHCGRFTVKGTSPAAKATRFHRVNCKCWKCSLCGPKKAKRYKHAIRAVAEKLGLCRFLTLTLDPKKIEGDPVRFL